MIKLEVKPYCENCEEFEASVDKNAKVRKFFDPVFHSTIREVSVETIITCEHSVKCANLYRCIAKDVEKN